VTVWLPRPLIEAIHQEQIEAHGGAEGLRDEGLLEGALVDGKKRTSYVALELFLALNGMRFPVKDADAVAMILGVAGHEIAEAAFIAWVRDHAAVA